MAGAVLAAVSALFFGYLLLSPDGAPPLRCPFKAVTGLDCPGCGSQRAFQAALKGDLGSAWVYNPAALIALPLALVFIFAEAGREVWPRFHRRVMSLWTIGAVGVALIVWWVARNL